MSLQAGNKDKQVEITGSSAAASSSATSEQPIEPIEPISIQSQSELYCVIKPDVFLENPVTFHNPYANEGGRKEQCILSEEAALEIKKKRDGEINSRRRRNAEGVNVSLDVKLECPFCRKESDDFYPAEATKKAIKNYVEKNKIDIRKEEYDENEEREYKLIELKRFFNDVLRWKMNDDPLRYLYNILYYLNEVIGNRLPMKDEIFEIRPIPHDQITPGQTRTHERVEKEGHPFKLLARVCCDFIDKTDYTLEEMLEKFGPDVQNKTTKFTDLLWEHFVRNVAKAYCLLNKLSEREYQRFFAEKQRNLCNKPQELIGIYQELVDAGIIKEKIVIVNKESGKTETIEVNYLEALKTEIERYKYEVNRNISLHERLFPAAQSMLIPLEGLLALGANIFTIQDQHAVLLAILNSRSRPSIQQEQQEQGVVISDYQPNGMSEEEALEAALAESREQQIQSRFN